MSFLDTLKLGFDNNLITGNLPDKVNMEQLNEKISKQKSVDSQIESFGLFDKNTSNYNTYYPGVTSEDLMPKDDDFIQPIFRALSEVIVHKDYNPVDFGMNDALKKSMPLLVGATVNADHEMAIGNAMGAVMENSWQKAYTTENGLLIPAGINSKLKIDGKSHPRVARAILMDPPAIHSTSVTVQFLWDKSHANLTQDEFFTKLGSVDKDGNLIRRIVSSVKRYHEISLVSHGADPYAQLIKDAKIINPTWGDISYNSITGPNKKSQKYFLFDYKTDIINNSIPPETNNDSKSTNIQNTIMKKDFLIALAAIIGVKIENKADQEEIPQTELDLIQNKITKLVNDGEVSKITHTTDQAEITRLKEIETKYNTESAAFANAVALQTFRDNETKRLRDEVVNQYKLVNGKTSLENDPIGKLVESATFETLQALNSQYKTQLADKFPLSCKKCGSTEVNRATAQQSQGDDGVKNNPIDFRSKLKSTAKSNSKGIKSMQE